MRQVIRTVLATTVVVGVLAPSAALARSETVDDATGDVWERTFEKGAEEPTLVDVGSIANVDVDEVVVAHAERRISVRLAYRALRRNDTEFMVDAILRFDETQDWVLGIDVTPGEDGWVVAPYAGEHGDPARGDEPVCEGLRGHVDWSADTVAISMPRSCVDGPAWVRAHVVARGFSSSEEDGFRAYYDNAHVKGSSTTKGWTDRIRRG